VEKKTITFFMITNNSGSPQRFVVSASWVKALSVIGAVIILAFAAAAVDYFGLLAQTIENKRLRSENAQLVKQFQVIEGKVSALENSLEKVKTFSTKLKLITNVESEDRALKLAMGVNGKQSDVVEEMDQPLDERAPVSQLAKQDKEFFEKKPLSEDRGELTEESPRDYASLVIRIDKSVKETQLREQSVIELWETLSERQSLINSTPNIKPAKGWLTSKFGYRLSPFTGRPAMHAGLDVAASPGSPVYAPADGVVSFVGYDEGYGKLISIDHGYGVNTRFGHNSQIYVQVGQRVSRWDVIGAVGSTGRSTGPHLHYEVRINGTAVNPANFILDE
jgi:murein DD-endopeptidase MepM/ murein hydrolase activator NlpD